MFSLSMLHMVLSVAGPALAYDDALARLVQVELLSGMCQAVVRTQAHDTHDKRLSAPLCLVCCTAA